MTLQPFGLLILFVHLTMVGCGRSNYERILESVFDRKEIQEYFGDQTLILIPNDLINKDNVDLGKIKSARPIQMYDLPDMFMRGLRKGVQIIEISSGGKIVRVQAGNSGEIWTFERKKPDQ